jgi:hypothetical protein
MPQKDDRRSFLRGAVALAATPLIASATNAKPAWQVAAPLMR